MPEDDLALCCQVACTNLVKNIAPRLSTNYLIGLTASQSRTPERYNCCALPAANFVPDELLDARSSGNPVTLQYLHLDPRCPCWKCYSRLRGRRVMLTPGPGRRSHFSPTGKQKLRSILRQWFTKLPMSSHGGAEMTSVPIDSPKMPNTPNIPKSESGRHEKYLNGRRESSRRSSAVASPALCVMGQGSSNRWLPLGLAVRCLLSTRTFDQR
nr:hypothetical protein CFP56_25799 [Quercus suber]